MLSLNHSVYIALLLALTASLHNQAYASQANESALPNLFSSTVIYQSQGEKLVNTIIKKRDWRGKLCLQDLDRQTHPGYQPPIGRIIFSIHEHGITQYPSPGDYFQNCSLDARQSISTPFTEPLQPFENHQGLLGCALTGCTVNDLSGFYIENHNDEGDWKYRTIALSFDPEAQLLIEKIQGLGRNEHVSHLNQEQTLAFTYPLDKGDKIDFSGIWRQTLYQAQTIQYRCLWITPQAIRLGPTGQHECPTQETLYRIDISDQFRAMWWRDNPEPYAQLAQLNTTVTWYDPDLGRQWVSWEYQPAGKNWDLGVLYRFQQQKFLDDAGMEKLRLLHASEFVKQHDSQLKS